MREVLNPTATMKTRPPDRSAPNANSRQRQWLVLTEVRFDRTAERHFGGRNVRTDQPMRRRSKLVSHLRRSPPRSQAVRCRYRIAQVMFRDELGKGAVMA